MSKLVLKFESSVLQEVPVGPKEVSIGRSPDNGLVIDNPAVSHYHARVFREEDRLMLEDFGSLNGTFVNGQRVKMVTLHPGDAVGIGKHTIVVADSRELDNGAANGGSRPATPKINETVMLDTKDRRDLLQRVAAAGESVQVAPQRLKIPSLLVLSGATDQHEYLVNDKLTIIGKSGMATVKLTGWFKPKAAAQITRRERDAYFISSLDRVPKLNGAPISHATELRTGDIIEVAGVKLEFLYRD